LALINIVPLTEAAAFTFGCALLRTRWFDPEWVGLALSTVVVLLVAGLLVVQTSRSICIDTDVLDPAMTWPSPTTRLPFSG
jgi:hypothetical protein